MLILHDPHCADYRVPGHPERPERVRETASHLRTLHPAWTWRVPEAAADEALLLAHAARHLLRLEEPRDFDGDTAWLPGIAGHARRAAAGAIAAARHARETRSPVFSLMRPPGHHATADRAMGFCYLNSVAVAALAARRDPAIARVAVWDFDAHHGNGTEAILQGREGFLYCSVHQYPCYPGTGGSSLGNCRNWPVAPGASREAHLAALRASWEAVTGFRPDLVLVSAGFDAYAGDPLTAMSLEQQDFAELGRWLHEARLPAAAVLEGGYSDRLPELIEPFLAAWEGPAALE
jgi:acetoin utilization deacetylase AcuC-like enzyme